MPPLKVRADDEDDEDDNHEENAVDATAEDDEHATNVKTDSSNHVEFDLDLMCNMVCDMEGQGGGMNTVGLTDDESKLLSSTGNPQSVAIR